MLTRDWRTTAAWHDRISLLQDQVEGYPVFLPARSMSQADYIEILTLLRKAARERGGKRGAGGGAANGNTADGKPHREASTRDTDGNACNGTGSGQHTPPISVTHTTPATKPTTYCCECMSHPRTATGRESALIVSQANPTHNHTDSISSSSSSSSTSPFSMTNSAFSTSAGSNSTIKQYPLHTKRAQTVAMWLQAMVLIERGEGVGSEAGVNGSSVNGIGVNGTGVNGTGAKPTVASIEAQLRDVQVC
ncbi:uncharacterized protein EV422DRAFT_329624 [Fimicolochytrium jonesii]|uniref:uncharacterized protein n=1 Tax=Fimicolochytrium jonesii TaxID=1396493 RepID=UPI0022FF20CD|nr:uncharacterized protein EV422DRAFT_329624 [Fimicolochytrium jonesii]KAI8816184.1 hypothetical protein EV422DRAFT_329624 [Fimicolochytrium jonesii]